MSALRRDLLERRLWLLVAVLLAAIVGVPLLMLKSGPSIAADAGQAASGASEAAGSAVTSADMKAGSLLVDVLMPRRDPLAAAASATKTSATRRHRAATSTHVTPTAHGAPTSGAAQPTSGTGSPSSSSGSGSASTGPSGSSHSGSAGTGTSGTASTGTGSTPPPTPASVAPTTTTVSPTTTTASEPVATTPHHHATRRSWTIYAVDVRFGRDLTAPIRRDLPRLTLLPSPQRPDVMFVGVLDGGRQAAFSIAPGVRHHGAGSCRPRKRLCTVIVLSPGQTEILTIAGVDGTPRQARLHVTRIRRTVTHSHAAALKAYRRVSAAGQCELNLSQPLAYDGATGTVSAQGGAPCRYELPSTTAPSRSAPSTTAPTAPPAP